MNILVITADYYGYGSSIVRTLRMKGDHADLLSLNQNGTIPYIRDKLLPKLKILWPMTLSLERFQREVRDYIANRQYDAIIAFFGNTILTRGTLKWAGARSPRTKSTLWLSDKLERRPACKDLLPHFTRVFTFESSDIPEIEKFSTRRVERLMLFCDDTLYHPASPKVEKDIDLLFVGAWHGPNYRNRRGVLRHVSRICRRHNLKMLIIGPAGWRSPVKYIRDLSYARGFFDRVYPGQPSHGQINDLYQRSKVILNVPIDSQIDGYPMRVFEVPGSGNCLLTQYMPGLENVYDCSDEIAVFHDLGEFESRCLELLQDDKRRTRIAENGYRRTMSAHTLSHRLGTLLRE